MRFRRIGVVLIALAMLSLAAPVEASSTSTAIKNAKGWLKSLKTVSLNSTPYSRTDDFGTAWVDVDGNGCKTRDDILKRDLTGETFRDRCVVITGRLVDPYTGKKISFSKTKATAVQIDHIIPLHLAWQLGATKWSFGKRVTFANDPLNLLAVDGPTNGSKSDSGPDEWLPPKASYRCTYVMRFIRVAFLYQVGVTSSMKSSMTNVLNHCTSIVGNPTLLKALPTSVYSYAAAIG